VKASELKNLLELIDRVPDDANVSLKIGHSWNSISLVLTWDGSAGPTEVRITIPRQKRKREANDG